MVGIDGMMSINPIPVDLQADHLAARSSIPLNEARTALEIAGPLLVPAGVFEEIDPQQLAASKFGPPVFNGSRTIIIGLCQLGNRSSRREAFQILRSPIRGALIHLLFRDALDFLEYRIRQFLKPTGRQPGPRRVPGCRELPLEANRTILNYFGPEHHGGLTTLPSGEMDTPAGLAFAYPTTDKTIAPDHRCAGCTRNCPARIE